jgi:oxygen-independent coproporphyrinogen-3 oxidase
MYNVKNNSLYWSQIKSELLPLTLEELKPAEIWNEYILIALRTREGIRLKKIADQWGEQQRNQLLQDAKDGITRGLLQLEDDHLRLTKEGKLLADQIAADFFQIAG